MNPIELLRGVRAPAKKKTALPKKILLAGIAVAAAIPAAALLACWARQADLANLALRARNRCCGGKRPALANLESPAGTGLETLLGMLPEEPCRFHLEIKDNGGTLDWIPNGGRRGLFRCGGPKLQGKTLPGTEAGQALREIKKYFASLPGPEKMAAPEISLSGRGKGKTLHISFMESKEKSECWGETRQERSGGTA